MTDSINNGLNLPGFNFVSRADQLSVFQQAQSQTSGAAASGAVDDSIYTLKNLEDYVTKQKPDVPWYDDEFIKTLEGTDKGEILAKMLEFSKVNSSSGVFAKKDDSAVDTNDIAKLKQELIKTALASTGKDAEFQAFMQGGGNPLDSASLSNAALAAMLNGPAIDYGAFTSPTQPSFGGAGAGGGVGGALEQLPALAEQVGELVKPKDGVITDTYGGGTGSTAPTVALEKIPTGYDEAFGNAVLAKDPQWGAPKQAKFETIIEPSVINDNIDSIGENFDENGNYKFVKDLTNGEKLAQVNSDLAAIEIAQDYAMLHSKNEQIGIGNKLGQDLHADGKAQTEKVCGSPLAGKPEEVVNGNYEGTIPKAMQEEYKKVGDKFGLGEKDDKENQEKVTAEYISKQTTKEDVQSAIKVTDKIGELMGQREYLGKVEAGAGKDKADAENEMKGLEKDKGKLNSSLRRLLTIINPSAKVSEQIDETKLKIDEITTKTNKISAEIKRLGELLSFAKEERPKIEEKLKANTKKRTEEITAIKSGTNGTVKNAIDAKQNKVTAVQNKTTEVVNAVSGAAESEQHTDIQLGDASLFTDKATNLVTAANNKIKQLKEERKTKIEQLTKTKEELTKIRDEKPKEGKSLKELGTDEATKGQKPSPGKEETVEIKDSPAKGWENLKVADTAAVAPEKPSGLPPGYTPPENDPSGPGRALSFNNMRGYRQDVPESGANVNIVDTELS